ncbi:phage portal protein [uncultured Desulfosarcina sp.]|uniref:phage portal protein n=1 Tax=uncultured Desulfosarcina sp. TaxID=218289 RepID=UPI0029C961AF|nr:phage portal protein [uncultured Desulfosarcina sp.]
MNRLALFQQMLGNMAAMAGKPLLYGADNRPLTPSAEYGIRRLAAKRTGSMKNWIPERLLSRDQEAFDRQEIVKRCIDLSQNDPNAAGVVDSFAATVIGAGLNPHPSLDWKLLDIDKDHAREIQRAQRFAYDEWSPWADAGERMNFGQIQYQTKNHMIRFGEYFVLCLMLDDPARPFSLALLVINPLRVKTPVDLVSDGRIRDGVELGAYGQPEAFWVKKSMPGMLMTPDTSANFMRIPARIGHRWNMIHRFVVKDPDAVRGFPALTPAVKLLRDFNDLLDAELVSNVVTAALTYFIEDHTGDPWDLADSFRTDSETTTTTDGKVKKTHYEETWPGRILYGNPSEKPHLLSANRPGVTFEPFTKVMKKMVSMAVGIPYPVLFKDVEGVNFAGFRAAMLDAWRVYTMERQWHADGLCSPVWRMLQEEACLRRRFMAPGFYRQLHHYTRALWRGTPKGDIEPVKAAQADILLNKNNLKTKSVITYEHGGGDFESNIDTLDEEREMEEERGLVPAADAKPPAVEKPQGGQTNADQ